MACDVQLSELIGEVHDAALQPALWSDALPKTAAYIGADMAMIFAKDATERLGTVALSCGIEPHWVDSYIETYVAHDPATSAQCLIAPEQPIGVTDLMRHDEFRATRFYQEWAKPQGWVDFLAAVLEKSPDRVSLFGVRRHAREGLVDDECRRRMRLIVPHIRRAVAIGRLIERKSQAAAAFAGTMHGLEAGMILLDGLGRIMQVNASAQGLLADGTVLSAQSGRLVARDKAAGSKFDAAVAAAACQEGGVSRAGCITIPVPAGPGRHWVVRVLSLARHSRAHYAAAAAVFIHPARLEVPALPEAVARAYNLTPAELRVLHAIVQLGGMAETAVALGIAESTVKSHLLRVFTKTGSKRQADLVKLVASYASPLAR